MKTKMARISTLSFLIALLVASTTASATTYTFTSNSNNQSPSYYLNAGDSLSIVSGTFTGQVNSNATTAKITIAQGANFNPTAFEFLGKLIVNGSAKLPKINGYTSGLQITNNGTISVTGTTYVTGGTITNNYNRVITFTGSAQFQNNNATLVNKGTITAAADIYFGSAIVNNSGNITATGEIKLDANSTMSNTGKLYTKSVLTMINTTYTNTCRTIAERGVKLLGSTNFTNNGLLWASNAKGESYLENQSTITGLANSVIKSVALYNFGTIKGSGFLYFTGTTQTQSVIGSAAPTSNVIKVYDVTRTSLSSIFDFQAGTVYANVTYAVFAAPDTINSYPNCSSESQAIPLAINWHYFYVNLADNIPSLNWSSSQDAGSSFAVQRSYDGINFTTVKTIVADISNTVYSYNDAQVNTQAAIVYYRIKATEPTGNQKYSDTRTVKFSNSNGMTIQTVPNPFTSQFTISYQSSTRALISIKVYSLNGQLQLTKNAAVTYGFNSISVPEAALLVKGMYMIQVSNENAIVITDKIIKQ
jgi:hypothetical protein